MHECGRCMDTLQDLCCYSILLVARPQHHPPCLERGGGAGYAGVNGCEKKALNALKHSSKIVVNNLRMPFAHAGL
jgi:hypothetical protein